MSNRLGTRWRGKLPVPARAHPLVRQLVAEANRQMTTLTEISARGGMDRHSISTWCYRTTPNVRDLEAAGNALDLALSWRRREPETRARRRSWPVSTAFLSQGM